jgi:hypothetical protein
MSVRAIPSTMNSQEVRVQKEEQPGVLRQIGNGVVKVWNVVWEKVCVAYHGITILFFQCVSWFSPRLADKLHILWGHVTVAFMKRKADFREDQLQAELRREKDRAQALNGQIGGLYLELETLRVANDHLTWKKDQAEKEKGYAIKELEALTLGRAAFVTELREFREKNQQQTQELEELRPQKERLLQKLNEALKEKRTQNEKYNQALEEIGALRLKLDWANDYKQINQQIDQFHELCAQIPQEGTERVTRYAISTLIPRLIEHRKSLNAMLEVILKSPSEDKGDDERLEVPVMGILNLSQEETILLERIQRVLFLVEEWMQKMEGFTWPILLRA